MLVQCYSCAMCGTMNYLENFKTKDLGSFVVMVQLNISVAVVAPQSCTCDKTASRYLRTPTEAPE